MYFDFSGLPLETDTTEAKRNGRWERKLGETASGEFGRTCDYSVQVGDSDRRSQNHSLAALFSPMFGRYPYDGESDGYYSDRQQRKYAEISRHWQLPVFIFDPGGHIHQY